MKKNDQTESLSEKEELELLKKEATEYLSNKFPNQVDAKDFDEQVKKLKKYFDKN